MDVLRILHPGNLLEHQAQNVEANITVAGLLRGREVRRLPPQRLQQILPVARPADGAVRVARRQALPRRRRRRQAEALRVRELVEHVRLEQVARHAAQLAAERAQRDVVPRQRARLPRRQLGQVRAHRVVEVQRPLRVLLQQRQHGEDLRAAGDAVGAAAVDRRGAGPGGVALRGGVVEREQRLLGGRHLDGEGARVVLLRGGGLLERRLDAAEGAFELGRRRVEVWRWEGGRGVVAGAVD